MSSIDDIETGKDIFSDFYALCKVSGLAVRPEEFVILHMCLLGMFLALVNRRRRKKQWGTRVFLLQKSFLSQPSERHVWELKRSAEVHSSLQLCFVKTGLGKASETLLPAKTLQIKSSYSFRQLFVL